ncbi:PREDICTED: replication protein A 70 kDa DNA-binding subunit D-like [Ipomoea nil]|uniref:replication protein A 70 kDa DNA-binding subunit D-like n=1 Tax=Ipomoea nil TaxID=35883 RepID=UPI000901FF7D|nr:PREDICTED: replication protein A 70 kDa DNA-binding subunit D-like [Ipomoea nil]
MYVLANDISPMNTHNALRLRTVRAYDIQERKSSSVLKSKEVVFRDQQGTFLHAHIPKEFVDKFRSTFTEGKVYGVKNFVVITKFYSFKTSPHKFMIKFNYKTVVKELKGTNFPMHMYRLMDFKALKANQSVDEKQLFDVIGRVVEIHAPQEKVINGKNSRLIDFVIEDSDGIQLGCTVWDDHVNKVEVYYNSATEEPLLVLIQFCRARTCLKSGDIKICSSYDVTQLLFNQQSPEFMQFRESLCLEQTPMRSIVSQSSFNPGSSYTVSLKDDLQLRTLTEVYAKKEFGEFWVAARIIFIDCDGEWYYPSCRTKSCYKKLEPQKEFLYCKDCDRTWGDGILRYRIKIRVVDIKGNAPFVMWDREYTELLGMSALELKQKNSQGKNGVPAEIQSLVGLNLIFRIAFRREQFLNLLNAFSVMRIINDVEMLELHAPQLMLGRDKDLNSKLELELTEDDLWEDEDELNDNEAESPLQAIPLNLTGDAYEAGADFTSIPKIVYLNNQMTGLNPVDSHLHAFL